MKVAPLHKALQQYPTAFRHLIVHTGQHYDPAMSKVFFDELELPKPDFYLGVGSGSHAQQTAKVMTEFEKVMELQRPHLVVVVGDVNSTIACSLVSAKMNVPVAHVEAGLRSFDRTMPEEINRLLTDSIADYLFVSEPSGVVNLKREGVDEKKIFFAGNIMIDSLVSHREKAGRSTIMKDLELTPGSFILVTLHRPSNVDTKEGLESILSVFERLAARTTIVFPMHPRTKKMLSRYNLEQRIEAIKNLKLLEPLGYLDFLHLMERAKLVLTDSGGIQEETTFFGIPCLTMRENTERPITVDTGTNILCGLDTDLVVQTSLDVLSGKVKKGSIPELWDGKTAERIAKILVQQLSSETK